MSSNIKESVICVCEKVSKFDDCVAVSRYLDKWDLRTKAVKYFCRSCEEGRKLAHIWLREKNG